MYQKWTQRDIDGPMGTCSPTATQAILSELGGKGTRKQPPRQTQWEVAHKMIIGSKVNDRLGKR